MRSARLQRRPGAPNEPWSECYRDSGVSWRQSYMMANDPRRGHGGQFDDLEVFVEAFEAAQTLGQASLADFLPEPTHLRYAAVLRELIRVDLEYGWKRGRPQSLEGY